MSPGARKESAVISSARRNSYNVKVGAVTRGGERRSDGEGEERKSSIQANGEQVRVKLGRWGAGGSLTSPASRKTSVTALITAVTAACCFSCDCCDVRTQPFA